MKSVIVIDWDNPTEVKNTGYFLRDPVIVAMAEECILLGFTLTYADLVKFQRLAYPQPTKETVK